MTTLHAIGEAHLVARELKEAETAYRKSLDLHRSPDGHTGLAQTLMAQKHHTEALRELDRAAAIMKEFRRRPNPAIGRLWIEGVVPKSSEESWGGAAAAAKREGEDYGKPVKRKPQHQTQIFKYSVVRDIDKLIYG